MNFSQNFNNTTYRTLYFAVFALAWVLWTGVSFYWNTQHLDNHLHWQQWVGSGGQLLFGLGLLMFVYRYQGRTQRNFQRFLMYLRLERYIFI